jgi:hypothetical protein
MALKKTKQIKGYQAEYWRIIQINSNFDSKDSIVTLALYKNKATRDTDPNAILETYQYNLGSDFSEDIYDGEADKVKNIKLKEAYKIFHVKAQAETLKTELKDESLVFFADAEDI